MRLTKKTKQAIIDDAWRCYPAESCGVLIDGEYHACNNIASMGQFEIEPSQLIELAEIGEIQAIVHSHPDGTAYPSDVDKAQMALGDVPWLICAIGDGVGKRYASIRTHQPKDYKAPLLGRDYYHGLQDCYSLVRDYYASELGIQLNDYKRDDAWWESADNEALYTDNFAKEGFEPVTDLQVHDVILCRVGRTEHINHALIYLGNYTPKGMQPAIGDLVLHHPHGRLSVREVYGDSLQKRTALIIRHQSRINNEND